MAAPNQSPLLPLQIIVGAQLASLALFVGVAYVVTGRQDPSPNGTEVAQILAIAGVLPLGISSFVQRALLRSQHGRLNQRGGSDGQWRQAFFTAVIVGTALREATAIFGLLISLLTGEVLWSAAYAAIAAVGIGLSFPTPERYERWRRTGA